MDNHESDVFIILFVSFLYIPLHRCGTWKYVDLILRAWVYVLLS